MVLDEGLILDKEDVDVDIYENMDFDSGNFQRELLFDVPYFLYDTVVLY